MSKKKEERRNEEITRAREHESTRARQHESTKARKHESTRERKNPKNEKQNTTNKEQQSWEQRNQETKNKEQRIICLPMVNECVNGQWMCQCFNVCQCFEKWKMFWAMFSCFHVFIFQLFNLSFWPSFPSPTLPSPALPQFTRAALIVDWLVLAKTRKRKTTFWRFDFCLTFRCGVIHDTQPC